MARSPPAASTPFRSTRPKLGAYATWSSELLRNLARTLPVALRALARRTSSNVSILHRRVLPTEIDTNLHMNQAVYAEVFELGRVDWMVGTRAWRHWRELGINPMVASQTLTYRRELKPLWKYRIETRAVGTQGRMLQLQGILAIGDAVHALSDVQILLVGPDGVLGAEAAALTIEGRTSEARSIEDWTLR